MKFTMDYSDNESIKDYYISNNGEWIPFEREIGYAVSDNGSVVYCEGDLPTSAAFIAQRAFYNTSPELFSMLNALTIDIENAVKAQALVARGLQVG